MHDCDNILFIGVVQAIANVFIRKYISNAMLVDKAFITVSTDIIKWV